MACIYKECNLEALYNNINLSIPIYCKKHKEKKMILISQPQCKNNECNIQSIKKCRGYCARCFMFLYPGEKFSRNYYTIQKSVASFLSHEFNKRHVSLDPLQSGEIHLTFPIQTFIIQTISSMCPPFPIIHSETQRPIIIIYFNIDEYIDENGNKHLHCWTLTNKAILLKTRIHNWNSRLQCLKNVILSLIHSTQTQTIQLFL